MTYMAIFETYPKPRITVKQMSAQIGLYYQYYEFGDTAADAKKRLSDRLLIESKILLSKSKTFADAAAFSVEIVDETEAANDDE